MESNQLEKVVEKRTKIYNDTVKVLNEYTDITNLYSSQIVKLSNFVEKLKEKIISIKENNGILRIGIVGQVKAGKSSFINSLIFDGKNILPKASTPMTAALTVMSYSEKPFAEVEFYTKDDWKIIELNAKEYRKKIAYLMEEYKQKNSSLKAKFSSKKNIPSINMLKEEAESQLSEEVIAANELYEQAKRFQLNIDDFLGKTIAIKDIQSIEDLMGKLKNYVGVGGKFTPFTRNTKLHLNIPALKDIELVDTPGINDPIISRGMITRQYLAKCDCVFLLSYSGQFAGQEDTSFLINTLPNEGIRKIIMLGSKFDSVLLDEARKYEGNLLIAMKDVYKKLVAQAEETILPQIENNKDLPLMEALKESLPPIFISGLCYSIAQKNLTNLDEMETHILHRLQKSFPDFDFTQEILYDLANITKIKETQINELKKQSEEILSYRLLDLIEGQNREFSQQINFLIKSFKNQLEKLKTANIEVLEKEYKETLKTLKKAETDIKQEFFSLQLTIKKELNELIRDVKASRSDNKRIEIEKRDEVIGSERYGFLWLRKRDVWGVISYAKVYDAIDNIVKYVNKINEEIALKWSNLINLENLEKNILQIVTNCIDTSNENYDKNNVIRPLKNAIADILIEPYDVDSAQYEKNIRRNFSGTTVKGYDTDRLQELLADTIDEISKDIESEINRQKNNLINTLNNSGTTFVKSISNNAKKELEELKKQIEQQKYFVMRYNFLIKDLSKNIKKL
jgi:GTPase SAR1 family protein